MYKTGWGIMQGLIGIMITILGGRFLVLGFDSYFESLKSCLDTRVFSNYEQNGMILFGLYIVLSIILLCVGIILTSHCLEWLDVIFEKRCKNCEYRKQTTENKK